MHIQQYMNVCRWVFKVAPYSFNINLHLKKDEELKMKYLLQLWV